jgi:hypothetical protein
LIHNAYKTTKVQTTRNFSLINNTIISK